MSIEKGKSSSSDESVQSDLFHIIDNLPWDAAANNHQRHSGSSPSSLLIPAIAVSNLPDPIPPSSLELLTEPQTALTSEDLQNVFISAVFQIGLKQSSPKVLVMYILRNLIIMMYNSGNIRWIFFLTTWRA